MWTSSGSGYLGQPISIVSRIHTASWSQTKFTLAFPKLGRTPVQPSRPLFSTELIFLLDACPLSCPLIFNDVGRYGGKSSDTFEMWLSSHRQEMYAWPTCSRVEIMTGTWRGYAGTRVWSRSFRTPRSPLALAKRSVVSSTSLET